MTDSLIDIFDMRKRGKLDSERHKKRVKKAIKENLRDLISDVNIISSDGKKKIKIPLRFLDNYKFKHAGDPNQEGVGQGNKDGAPGDVLGKDGSGQGQGKPGDQPGEDIYEEEVELADLIDMMLEDLNLPWLEQKDSVVEVETESIVLDSISEVGPLSNVDKKRSVYENMKRNAKKGHAVIANMSPEDLRYKVWDVEKEYHSNAAVYMLMDRSGSMSEEKKYIAKSFFFWLTHFCKTRYKHVELIFIAHDSMAKIVPEEDFFKISSSGGTVCSTAFELALEHIQENHPPSRYNNFVFEFSDGDNYKIDNIKCVGLVNQLLEVCSAVGYGEIDTGSMFFGASLYGWSTLHDEFKKSIDHPKFLTAELSKKEDIYATLQQFLGIKETK